jgi:hypothetical protein
MLTTKTTPLLAQENGDAHHQESVTEGIRQRDERVQCQAHQAACPAEQHQDGSHHSSSLAAEASRCGRHLCVNQQYLAPKWNFVEQTDSCRPAVKAIVAADCVAAEKSLSLCCSLG